MSALPVVALFEAGDCDEWEGTIDDVGIIAEFLSYEAVELVVLQGDQRMSNFGLSWFARLSISSGSSYGS